MADAEVRYEFRITRGRFGFWWWHLIGRGYKNATDGGLHLPRRSATAVARACERFATKDQVRRHRHLVHEVHVPRAGDA